LTKSVSTFSPVIKQGSRVCRVLTLRRLVSLLLKHFFSLEAVNASILHVLCLLHLLAFFDWLLWNSGVSISAACLEILFPIANRLVLVLIRVNFLLFYWLRCSKYTIISIASKKTCRS